MTTFIAGVRGASPSGEDPSTGGIFDAYLAEAATRGLRKVSIDAVARRAKVSRTTINRLFGDREGLLAALAVREGERLAGAIDGTFGSHTDPELRLVEGFVAAVRYAQQHPVLSVAAKHDPALLIGAGLANDARLLRFAGEFLAGEIRYYQEHGRAAHLEPSEAGETLARLFVTWVLLPGGLLGVSDEEVLRRYARSTLVPMVLGSPA